MRQYTESSDEVIARVIILARKVGDRVAYHVPYRKPTQVGEERILRCSSESWLRNSASLPRNFGIRGPYDGRAQRNGPGDCLTKTHGFAKS